MREMDDADPLAEELIDLGRALPAPTVSPDLTAQVLARVTADEDVHVVGGARPATPGRRRWGRAKIAASIGALVGGLLLVPPVRATVLDWISLGGVRVQTPTTSATGSPGTSTPESVSPRVTATSPVDEGESLSALAQARTRVGLDFAVPASLGGPTSIMVLHQGKVVEMTWGTGDSALIMDVLTGSLDYGFLKSARDVEWTDVRGNSALWLPGDHDLQWIDRSGATQTAPPRTARPTLVWVVPKDGADITYRLEGAATKQAALALAAEVGP